MAFFNVGTGFYFSVDCLNDLFHMLYEHWSKREIIIWDIIVGHVYLFVLA